MTKENIQEWISVKERLPEENEAVLLFIPYHRHEKIQSDRTTEYETFEYGYYCLCTENDYILSSETDFFDRDECATHWMPLPEPPEEG